MANDRRRPTFTPVARAEFLEELALLGSTSAAAAAAGIPESVARYHRERDEEFAEECAAALDRHDRMLMRQVKKLAVDGVDEDIYDRNGQVIGSRKRYSERMLLRWLERQATGSWAARGTVQHQVSGKVEHEHSGRIEVENLTPEQRKLARRFLATVPDAEDPSVN